MAYNIEKAAQIVSYFVRKAQENGEVLSVLKASKLVYLADRKNLENYVYTLLDENRLSMENGPANEQTHAYLTGAKQAAVWDSYIRTQGENVVLPEGAIDDDGQLSEAETESMDAVWEEFKHMTGEEISEWTHDPDHTPEWVEPKNGEAQKIPMLKILKALNIEDPESALEMLEEHSAIDDALDNLGK